jgi:ATP-binding cassette, subfamily B, bacterial
MQTQRLMFDSKSSTPQNHPNNAHPLKRLLRYSGKYRPLIWRGTIYSILNKIFDLAPPALIGMAVDIVVDRDRSIVAKWGIVDVFWQLVFVCFVSLIIWGLESVFEYLYDRIWRNLAQNIQHEIRLDAYNHIQELEVGYFEENSTGGLLSILNDDVNQLERFLDVGANELLQVLTTVVVIGGTYFIITPSAAWLAMLPIPFILWGSIGFQNYLAPKYAEVREKVSLLNTRLANNLSGITTIKSFTTEAYELERLRQESNAYKQSNRRAISLSAAFIPLIRVLVLFGFLGILLFGGMETVNGKLAVGTYSVLVFLTQRLLWPLTRLGQTLDLYQRAMASTNRIMNLLDTKIAIASGDIPLPIEKVVGAIEFKNVSFAYRDRPPAIEHFNLDIPAGKTTAIVGSTGSGKSTLVKLILRFYEVRTGSISIDNLNIKDIRLHNLRQSIGLVSQDVFLFEGTVRENIAYGNPDASLDKIVEAARMAEAHDFISNLPQGYDTVVGERGQKLSGGQRQRLAIARAILKNPPILILDEATSAVDNETEAAIAKSLEKITKNRTTIAIAHRLSTIRHADCIHVMEYGKIIESGTHEELLEKEGVYANLWRVQTGLKLASN